MSKVIEQLSFELYRKIDRMNASTLVHGCKSMRALKRAMDGKADAPTEAMAFGNKYHSMILEPELFEESFCVMPNFAASELNVDKNGDRSDSWSTTYAKKAKAEFIAAARSDGKEIITRDEYDRGLAMCESIQGNQFAKELIDECDKEVTLLGSILGVEIKCRLDLCSETAIADVKGCSNASVVAFGKVAANLRYGFKLGLYREIWRQNFSGLPDVYLIALESNGDFDCCVYEMPMAVLEEGASEVRKVIERMKQCQDSGDWPGVDGGESPLQLYVPNWAMPDDEDLQWD